MEGGKGKDGGAPATPPKAHDDVKGELGSPATPNVPITAAAALTTTGPAAPGAPVRQRNIALLQDLDVESKESNIYETKKKTMEDASQIWQRSKKKTEGVRKRWKQLFEEEPNEEPKEEQLKYWKDKLDQASYEEDVALGAYKDARRQCKESDFKPWEEYGDGSQSHTYSDYVSYNMPSKGILFPWKLTKEKMLELKKYYITSEDLEDDVVKSKIWNLLESFADAVKEGNDFSFFIPKRSPDFMDIEPTLAMPMLRRTGKKVKRSFFIKQTRRTTAVTLWVLRTIYDIIEQSAFISPRDLYYRGKWLFKNPAECARIITDICVMLECSTSLLHILPEERGAVLGKAIIRVEEKGIVQEVDCTSGVSIPMDLKKIKNIVLDEKTVCVVVVEKGTMYYYLKANNFAEDQHCLLVTAFGMPDERTRAFVRLLEKKTNVPIFGVTDPDPYGVSIMKTYAKGSVTLCHDNLSLCNITMHWIGICTTEITKLNFQGKTFSFDRCPALKPKERAMLKNLQGSKKYDLSPKWKERISHMMKIGKKACFEDMHSIFGYKYVSTILLPRLIRDVMESIKRYAQTLVL
ncbi:hypothetical protein EJB05_48710, partial [Eragrostis curvula]